MVPVTVPVTVVVPAAGLLTTAPKLTVVPPSEAPSAVKVWRSVDQL